MQLCYSTGSVILNVMALGVHVHSMASTAPTDLYSAYEFQSTLLGCQVTLMSHKPSHYVNNGWTFSGQTLYKSQGMH